MTGPEIIRPLLPAPPPKAASSAARGGRAASPAAIAAPGRATGGGETPAIEAVLGVAGRGSGQRATVYEEPERILERSALGRGRRTPPPVVEMPAGTPAPPAPFLAQYIEQEMLSEGLYISPLPAALAAYRGAAGRIDAQAALARNLDIVI